MQELELQTKLNNKIVKLNIANKNLYYVTTLSGFIKTFSNYKEALKEYLFNVKILSVKNKIAQQVKEYEASLLMYASNEIQNYKNITIDSLQFN